MSNPFEPVSVSRSRRVLVVEDDLTSRELLRITLQKKGYTIVAAADANAAQAQLEAHGVAQFDCVVTDYRMPERTGLELLSWIKQADACLATIILTAEGEKAVIAESLRSGAADFLDKPVNFPKLFTALAKAINETERQRELARSDSAVKTLGRTQQWMLQSGRLAGGKFLADVCFHPKLEAGGDFLGHFPINPETHCCLLTDVSGHDLQAAYIAAYFHGVFQGMLRRAAPLPEIFSYFNDFLCNEWNHPDRLEASRSSGTSLAVAAVLFDLPQQVASILTCGAPVPAYAQPDGRVQMLGEQGGLPLGWFSDSEPRTATQSIAGGGTFYLWTDGLVDLAEAHGVHPLCLTFALQQAKAKGTKHPLLDQANDDILCAAIQVLADDPTGGALQPLLVENYRGDQGGEIDELAARWRRNLKLAFPDLSEAAEHDILLATREAVLNACKHGCQQRPDKSVRVQLSYHRLRHAIRVWVEDPGTGHQFDLAAHTECSSQQLIDEHRGLIFIMNLAHSVKYERNGATIIPEFQL